MNHDNPHLYWTGSECLEMITDWHKHMCQSAFCSCQEKGELSLHCNHFLLFCLCSSRFPFPLTYLRNEKNFMADGYSCVAQLIMLWFLHIHITSHVNKMVKCFLASSGFTLLLYSPLVFLCSLYKVCLFFSFLPSPSTCFSAHPLTFSPTTPIPSLPYWFPHSPSVSLFCLLITSTSFYTVF